MPNISYIAQLTDGSTSVRSSKTRAYTHAIQITRATEDVKGESIPGVLSWHTSEALAHKATGSKYLNGYRVVVVPVTAHPYSSPEAKAARAALKGN